MIKLQPFQKIKQSLVLKPTIWQASVPPDLCHSAEGCLCCPLSKRFFIVSSAASFGVHVPMRPSCWRERAWTPFKKKTRSYTPSHALNLSAPCCSETLNSVRLSACSSYTHHTLDLELPEPLMVSLLLFGARHGGIVRPGLWKLESFWPSYYVAGQFDPFPFLSCQKY